MGSPSGRPYLPNEAMRGACVPPLPGSEMGHGNPMAYGMVSLPMSGNCTPVSTMVQGSPAGSVHGSPMGQPGMEQQQFFAMPPSPQQQQQGYAQGHQPGVVSMPPWPMQPQQQYPGAISTPAPGQYPSMQMHDGGAMQQMIAVPMMQEGPNGGAAYGAPVNQQYDPVMAGMQQQPQQQPQQQGQQAYFA